jgi:hypothetical protein
MKRKKLGKSPTGQFVLLSLDVIVKGKAIPLQGWTGPEGSSRFRLPDFKTIST